MKSEIRAVVTDACGQVREIEVGGQIGRTLKALVEAGPCGVTSLDIAATWALRTSHYIYVLRQHYGLAIEMIREPHKGLCGPAWHGRYRLSTPVRILEAVG